MAELPPNPFARSARAEWLSLQDEPVLDPSLPIIDTHHHFADFPGHQYLLPDLQSDLGSGHAIVATVFIEGRVGYRVDGPPELRPVGETAFVRALSREAGKFPTRIAAGIVANAELTMGDKVSKVLEAHIDAADGALRGVRQIAPWDPDPALDVPGIAIPPGLFLDDSFRQGFARLADYDLTFDAWLYPSQFSDLLSLADAFPHTRIVIDFAPPVRIGERSRNPSGEFEVWRDSVHLVSHAPNIWMKLGGVGMPLCGFNFLDHRSPPSSSELTDAWRPYFQTYLDAFGIQRCMFGSNFPVDKGSFSYKVFWNACKRLTQDLSAEECSSIFLENAAEFYRLGVGTRREANNSVGSPRE